MCITWRNTLFLKDIDLLAYQDLIKIEPSKYNLANQIETAYGALYKCSPWFDDSVRKLWLSCVQMITFHHFVVIFLPTMNDSTKKALNTPFNSYCERISSGFVLFLPHGLTYLLGREFVPDDVQYIIADGIFPHWFILELVLYNVCFKKKRYFLNAAYECFLFNMQLVCF